MMKSHIGFFYLIHMHIDNYLYVCYHIDSYQCEVCLCFDYFSKIFKALSDDNRIHIIML